LRGKKGAPPPPKGKAWKGYIWASGGKVAKNQKGPNREKRKNEKDEKK